MSTSPELSAATARYIQGTPLDHRKRLGQYFTPRSLRDALLEDLALPRGARVLDPACGTGEFFETVRRHWPAAKRVGYEIDRRLCELARAADPRATIEERDALAVAFHPTFDAVIGNPPYFETPSRSDLLYRYGDVISGRPNTYALFVKLGIELLKPGGVLAFVVSPSMNNGRYFRDLRDWILRVGRVERIRVLDRSNRFEGAQQAVMLFRVVKGEPDDGRHVWRRGDLTLFTEDPPALDQLFAGAVTLAELGCSVKTGGVVWNQNRDRLTNDRRGAVRLIWAKDIGMDGTLDFVGRAGKPGFVRGREPLRGPAIVVNRVTGAGRAARLRAALVPTGVEFVGENHVNVVLPPPGAPEREVARIVDALRDERAIAAVRRLTGNTQVSSVELRHLVPLRPDPPR